MIFKSKAKKTEPAVPTIKEPDYSFTLEIPESLYYSLLAFMTKLAVYHQMSCYPVDKHPRYDQVEVGDLKPLVHNGQLIGIYGANSKGFYRVMPGSEAELCVDEIHKVKETRTIEVEVDKTRTTYKKHAAPCVVSAPVLATKKKSK